MLKDILESGGYLGEVFVMIFVVLYFSEFFVFGGRRDDYLFRVLEKGFSFV